MARLLPDVVVSVDAHHDGANATAALEEHDPRAVAKEEDGEDKLDAASDGANPVNVIVQRLPYFLRVGVDLRILGRE